MLGIFGKKSDHPMADLKSAQALLADLPKNDALKALQELTGWIESVREQAEFRLEQQVMVLRLLDETARPFERKLTREYFAVSALPPFQENRLWVVLNEFFVQLLQAYRSVLARVRNGDKGASSLRAMLPLIAARGVNAAAGRLKFAAAHYAFVDQEIWVGLADFYQHAEAQQYLNELLQLYAGAESKTSVRQEFATVLMWHATCFGTLSRNNMHLAERLAAYLSQCFTVSAQRDTGSRFIFDLHQPMSPMRLGADAAPLPSLRFLGVEKLQPQMDGLLKALEKNFVPKEINLGGVYEAEAVRSVALHLAECMAWPPPMRRNARHNIKVSLSVASGFVGVMEQAFNGLNFGSDANASWRAEDISTSGLRCIRPAAGADKIEIGMLLGLKPERVERWGVGIVRRITRDPHNNQHIGIEKLANEVDGVALRERAEDEEQHALWLDSPGGNAAEVDLLMSPASFTPGRSLHTQLGSKRYLLIPLRLVESGVDFDLARYRKVEEDAAAGEVD